MEQLTGQAIESLVRIARARPAALALWKQRPAQSADPLSYAHSADPLNCAYSADLSHDAHSASFAAPPAAAAEQRAPVPQDRVDAPLIGIERRLARRAEALWDGLRGTEPMPDASASAALLGPPFSGFALLLTMPPLAASAPAVSGRPAAPALPYVSFVGEALAALSIVFKGPVVPDSRASAPLAARLAALAEQAVAKAAPVSFDSEGTPVRSGAGSNTPLLMRAIALPLATAPLATAGEAGATVVIIVSWRELLSPDETDALHRELAAAIGWMQAHKPSG